MATIRDVSKKAGVSVATASRVVNSTQWVAPETRARVIDAMDALGYQPNSYAKALATNRSDILGMVVGDLSGPFFGDLMARVELEARQQHRHLLITSGGLNREEELDAVDFLLRRQVDALILHVDSMTDADLHALTRRTETPIVLINRFVPELKDQCIHVNNELGGRKAVEHLLAQGHTDIACMTGPLYKSDSRARLHGYRQALEGAGLTYSESLVVEADYMEPGGSDAMARLLDRGHPITAVACGNDLMAYGAIRLLKDRGLSVPGDVAVTGYDDIVMSGYFEPGLTTIHVPVGDMGKQAAQLAVALAEKRVADVHHQFNPDLIIRDSVQPLDSSGHKKKIHSL